MKITRRSMLTNIISTREIPITSEQLRSWEEGELIQKAMPNLDKDDREFIISGNTPDEWYEAFGNEEE